MRARIIMTVLAGALCGAPVFAQQEQGGDADRGEELFRECSGCHQVGAGAVNRVGPQLNHIFDRKVGNEDTYRYSGSMMELAESGGTWDYQTLDAFIESPRDVVARTRMSYRGMGDPQDRADLLAYLRRFSDQPIDIPESAPTAAQVDHSVAPEVLAIVGDPAYGEYLSTECTSCHQASGDANGIPSITNWPVDIFVITMHAYKTGEREHNVMQMMAQRLSDEEIAALAAYFEKIE